MTAIGATLCQPDDITVWRAAVAVITRPWKTFVVDWNWKAALLSALFRGVLFLAVAIPRGPGAMRLVWIELAFRVLVGGFWGSLLQAFRGAPPASRCAGPSAGESDEHPDDPPDRPLIRKGEAS